MKFNLLLRTRQRIGPKLIDESWWEVFEGDAAKNAHLAAGEKYPGCSIHCTLQLPDDDPAEDMPQQSIGPLVEGEPLPSGPQRSQPTTKKRGRPKKASAKPPPSDDPDDFAKAAPVGRPPTDDEEM